MIGKQSLQMWEIRDLRWFVSGHLPYAEAGGDARWHQVALAVALSPP